MPVTICIILDTRRIKEKTKKYPVKLRVTYDRTTENYPTVFDLTAAEFEKFSASRINAELQTTRDKLKALERNAQSAAEGITPFQFKEFEKDFVQHQPLLKQKKAKPVLQQEASLDFDWVPFHKKFPILKEPLFIEGTLGAAFSNYIRALIMAGRIGTAASYHCAYVSLIKFRGNPKFTDVTTVFLTQYENWMKEKDISKSTVGIYIRPIRALFNEAIDNGLIKKEKCYPFGRRKYRIPTGKNVKKSLDLQDVMAIYNYQCDTPSVRKGRDFWLFCYFSNGMNPKDVANLKYKNIEGDYLVFERAKTENTMRSDPKAITVYITVEMKSMIAKYGNKDASPNNYLFPILEPGLSALRQYELVQLFFSFINNCMRDVAKALGINKKVTTYVARHTFSTVMKRSGASTEYIQEALGHTDVKTTENYLDSFEKEVKKQFAHRLLAE